MRAVEALKAARAAGVHLGVDGDALVLDAASAPPAAVLDALSRHKAEIVALLRPDHDGWSAEDWQAYFDERAGIVEFDGGVPRLEAEAYAFECCVVEWLNRHPVPSDPGRCAWCGKAESLGAVVLPFGTEPGTHCGFTPNAGPRGTTLAAIRPRKHSRCWASTPLSHRLMGGVKKTEDEPVTQTHETRLANLRAAPRCEARNRAGTPCQCPAMCGRKRCRLHGGLSPGGPQYG